MHSYDGCSLIVLDENENHIAELRISTYNEKEKSIELSADPILPEGISKYDLIIMVQPAPVKCIGVLRKMLGRKSFLISNEVPINKRVFERFNMSTPVVINGLIADDAVYPLQRTIAATLVNISRNGLRLRAPANTFVKGNTFAARLSLKGVEKTITATVVNYKDSGSFSEFGCRLLGTV